MVKASLLNRTFRKYFGPVHTNPLLFKTFFSVIWFIGFVLFSPVRPIVQSYPVTTVTENASYQNAFQRGDFWINLLLVYVWTDENGGFRIPWSHTSYTTRIMHAPEGMLSYFHRFLNCVDGRKLWKRFVWKPYSLGSGDKVSVSNNIRIRVDKLLFIIYQRLPV